MWPLTKQGARSKGQGARQSPAISPVRSSLIHAPCHLRPMWPEDLDQVLAIEREAFTSDAWQRAEFGGCFALHSTLIGLIAEAAGRIVGYGVADRMPHAAVVRNLAVMPPFRRMGVGRLLVAELCRPAGLCQPRSLHATIRESNLAAQLFFRSLGWRAQWIARRPWPGCPEDGYRFRFKVRECRGK